MTDATFLDDHTRLRLYASTRDYTTRIERRIGWALATHAAATSHGLVGKIVVILSPEITLHEHVRAMMGFPRDITPEDIHCGLLLLQQSDYLTIAFRGRVVLLAIAPAALPVDTADTTAIWGFEELREAA